jgi:hypothetical protein
LHYLTIEDIFIRVGTRVLARLHNPVEIIHSLAGVVFEKTDGVRPPFRVFVCDACSLTGESCKFQALACVAVYLGRCSEKDRIRLLLHVCSPEAEPTYLFPFDFKI